MAKKVSSGVPIDHQMKIIGEKVREMRRKQNPNYEAWSYLNGINKVSLSRCERGENVTMKIFLEILQKLEVPVQNFFSQLPE